MVTITIKFKGGLFTGLDSKLIHTFGIWKDTYFAAVALVILVSVNLMVVRVNHWGCKYETDHNWELLFRTLQWWYFGKYKYISNKGELKGNHRGSRSPFQIQGLGDTEITGGMNTGSVTSRKFSRSIYGSWKIRICRLCVSWIIKKIEAHVKGSFKKYFLEQWGRHAHAKKPTAQVCASNW